MTRHAPRATSNDFVTPALVFVLVGVALVVAFRLHERRLKLFVTRYVEARLAGQEKRGG